MGGPSTSQMAVSGPRSAAGFPVGWLMRILSFWLDGVVPDDALRDLSIEMALLGGKLRAVAEFRELAREVGLEVLAAGRQPFGTFVVECRST